MKTKHYIIILIIVIVLAGGAWWWSHKKTTPTDTTNNTQTEQTNQKNNTSDKDDEIIGQPATNQLASSDSIAVSDQAKVATSVTIDNVNISKASFIVITIPGKNGATDQIIGTSGLVSPGMKQDLEVNLKAGTKLDSNIEYTALLYADDGDKKFNVAKDTKLSGPTASSTFSAV